MPRSLATEMDPLRWRKEPTPEPVVELRIPQARVLEALVPYDPSMNWTEWPSITSWVIAEMLGASPKADYVRRAMRGLREGSPSGTPHKGLIDLGYVVEFKLDICGVEEIHYRITKEGIAVITEWLKHNKIPPKRDASKCVNDRYKLTSPSTSLPEEE